ncbi:hypothetical protein K402DRAFT_329726, partial [Aulographum hederae CBS 113979]
KKMKTYDSRDSHVVTHRSTSLPIHGLNMTERTGCLVFRDQWSYVQSYPYLHTIMFTFCALR